MEQTMKKIGCLLLALCLLVGLMPFTAVADGGTKRPDPEWIPYAVEGGNIYLNAKTGKIMLCDPWVTAAEIPSEIDGVAVVGINEGAFYNQCENLTSVTLPEGLTSIGSEAFLSCWALTSVTLPESLTSIGERAFSECGLESLTIPAGVTEIDGWAFAPMLMGNGNVLREINVAENNPNYCSVDGVLFNKNKTMLHTYPCGREGAYEIPAGVTYINSFAFGGCDGLTSITIPESVTMIGFGTFSACSGLTSITIPAGVTYIGGCAFAKCYALASITIPESVTEIDFGTFMHCSALTSITIPAGVTYIGDSAFMYCRALTDVYYSGTEEQWNSIQIDEWENDALLNATIHYNHTDPKPDDPEHDHDWDEGVVTAPTCTEDGYTTHTCTLCGETMTDTIVEKLGHAPVIIDKRPATDSHYGYTGDMVCDVCGEMLEAGTFIPAKGGAGTPADSKFDEKPAAAAAATELPFADVKKDDQFYDSIVYVYQNKIMEGTSGTTFKPQATLNRATIVMTLYRLEGKPVVSGQSNFTDVPSGEWYSDAVEWAAANGIVNGYSNGNFGPEDPVTREQMAAIFQRYAQAKHYDVAAAAELSASAQVNDWAMTNVQWAVAQGLLVDGDAVDATVKSNRGEVAKALHVFLTEITK